MAAPLDGNAIAGELHEHFGAEMTTRTGACAHCGFRSQIAELRVYARAPGAVVRCPSCDSVVIVIVRIRGASRVDFDGLKLEP
jgi:DNA-directed RNA polymerase subunit RPC12/RpoP